LLNNALQQNIQLGVQNAELMETNGDNHWENIQPEATNTRSFNVAHPDQYCSGAQNFENVQDSLWSNSQYDWHLSYYGDSNKVQHPVILASRLRNHANTTHRQTLITTMVNWLWELRAVSDPHSGELERFSDQMQTIYRYRKWTLISARKSLTNILLESIEPVTVYANQIQVYQGIAETLLQDYKHYDELAWSRP
jgi:hypothetical protein